MKLNKKTVMFLTILLWISTSIIHAQASSGSGVYLNSHDYVEGKLSFSIQCNSKDKIKLNDFLSSTYVDIFIGGKTIQLNKDSIFGYHNCKNETYRFYKKHDEEFLILENKDVVLYLSYTKVSSNNGKTSHLIPAYFFSKTIDSEILPLTTSNLKKAFPYNTKLHDILNMEFGDGEALSVYSTANNMYKINYLLSQSNR